MKHLEGIIARIIRFRHVISVLLLIAVAFSGYQTLNKLRIDNALSIWFLEDNPNYKAYIEFQETFGSDEIFVGMLPVDNALDEATIYQLLELHNTIDALWYVNTSYSLATAQYPIYANKTLHFDDLYTSKRSEKGLKRLLKKLPSISKQLVTEDYKHLFFYIQLKPTSQIEVDREGIAKEIQEVIQQHYNTYYLTGAPVLNEAFSKGVYKESLRFGVLTILGITIMLLFLLPSKRYLLIALFSVGIPISILFGIITSFGYALNMISMLIPTILMVYSVSDVVHIINIYHRERLQQHSNYSKLQVIALVVQKSLTPCFYTTLTTVVGYFALYLSPLPAFKNMGILTCVGLLLAFVLVYVICIIGFSLMTPHLEEDTPKLRKNQHVQTKTIAWLNTLTSKHKNTIILVCTLLLGYGVFSIFKVSIDTNSLDLLAEGKEKNDLQYVESLLNSSSRLQLNITASKGTMLTTEAIEQLERFQTKLDTHTLLSAPVSIVNVKRFLQQRSPVLFQSNISKATVENAMRTVNDGGDTFFKLFSEDFKTAGITLGIKELKTSELEQILFDIQANFEDTFDTDAYQLKINGFSVVFSQLNHFILETQFKSFFAAFFVAFLCLWGFIKSFKTTVLVLIPNILPLALLAIVMCLLDIPLDVSTAMITPIMLGIAMDDTIHLVYKYKPTTAISGTSEQRINTAMRYTCSALFSTTIALVAGFLIISTSAVPSVRDFGILCAVTVAIALITDIIYLPALLKKFDK